jgi:hypothetical protein
LGEEWTGIPGEGYGEGVGVTVAGVTRGVDRDFGGGAEGNGKLRGNGNREKKGYGNFFFILFFIIFFNLVLWNGNLVGTGLRDMGRNGV